MSRRVLPKPESFPVGSRWYELFPDPFLTPIPPAPDDDWDAVPTPAECGEPLVDPTLLSPRITYGAAYLRQGLPGEKTCLVRQGAALRLCQAADKLPQGYGIYIFDSLRSLTVQKALYDQFYQAAVKEHPQYGPRELEEIVDEFVALPVKRLDRPSPHATGGAIDLTLSRDGQLLDMGTGFDDFTPLAYTDALERNCPPGMEGARDHRRLLFHLMESVGLVNYSSEWWHYAYGERQWAARTGRTPIYGFCPQCDFPDK